MPKLGLGYAQDLYYLNANVLHASSLLCMTVLKG